MSQPEERHARIATAICVAVAELPDRTSPEDWPDAMIVTTDELAAIVEAELAEDDEGDFEELRTVARLASEEAERLTKANASLRLQLGEREARITDLEEASAAMLESHGGYFVWHKPASLPSGTTT